MQNAIRLQIREGLWIGIYEGPHRSRITGLFGIPCLPTAFMAEVPGVEVLSTIQELNPNVRVYLGGTENSANSDELRTSAVPGP